MRPVVVFEPILDVSLAVTLLAVGLDECGGHVLLNFLQHGVRGGALLVLEQPLR